MRQRIGPALGQIMVCHLYSAKLLSKPMLGYCQLDSLNKLQWNSNQYTQIFIRENASGNIVCEKEANLSRGMSYDEIQQ